MAAEEGSGAGRGGLARTTARLVARLGRLVAALAGLVLLLAAAGLLALTQTRMGRDWVASRIEARLESAFPGEVELGPIVAGNLLTRAVLERLAIAEPGGEIFVALDSVRVSYDPTALLRDDFLFRAVRAARGRLQLLQARDGSWNFDRIFAADPTAPPGETRLSLHDLEILSGQIVVRMPWANDLEGAAYDSAVTAGLRGEALWRVEPAAAGEGYEQVVEVESLRGRFPLMRLAHPGLPVEIRMEGLSGVLRAVQQPLELLRFDGGLVFRDSIGVEIERARLPASRVSGRGWVVPSDPVAYRFELEGDPIGFADLQWLPVPVPEEGGGPMELVLSTQGEVSVVEVLEGEAEVRDSKLEGSFTLSLEEIPRFEALDLQFRPLRLLLVDRLLGREHLIDGYLDGRVSGSGPIHALRIDAEGTLRDLRGPSAPSGLAAAGAVSLLEPYRMRQLRLVLGDFESRWARAVGIELDLTGRLGGALTLDGVSGERMAVRADLRHRAEEYPESHLVGGGTFEFGETARVNVQVTTDPLALRLLDPYFPNLRLVGTVRGPLAARGTLDDLHAVADLQTPRGRLTFDGRFDLEAERKRYDAEVEARSIDLAQWAETFPETELAVRGSLRGEGTDPASLEAVVDLRILPSVFEEARVDTSLLRFRIAEGIASVDTFAVRTDVGEVRGLGGLGLAEELSGTLVLDVEAPDLSSWNRWLVEGRAGAGSPETPEDLFAGFPDAQAAGAGEADAVARPDTLAGSLSGRGVVFGNLDAFSLGGRLRLVNASYGDIGMDSLAARLDVARPRELDSLVMTARAWNFVAFGQGADSVTTRLERTGPGRAQMRLFAERDTALLLDVAGDAFWDDAGRRAALDRLRLRLGDQELRLAGPATVAYGDSGLVAGDFVLAGPSGELLAARGSVPADGEANFDLEFRGLRVEELLQPRPEAPELTGTLNGSLAIRGTSRSPRMDGWFRIETPGIASVTYRVLDGEFEYADRRVDAELDLRGESGLLARARGEIRADLAFRDAGERMPEEAFDFRITADSLPMQVIELIAESLHDVRGFVRGEVRVEGGPDRLRLDGEAHLVGGEARVPDLGILFLNAVGRARFRGSEARLDSLSFESSRGGRALVSGTVGLSDIRNPTLDLILSGSRFHAIDRRAMSFLLAGELALGGSYREPVLSGDARIFNGDLRQEEFLRTQEIIDLTDPEVFGLIDTTVVAERRLFERVQNPFMRNLRLDVDLDVGPNLWLRSAVLDVELLGDDLDVRMDRAEESLVMFGSVQLVRGTYVFDRIPPYRQQLRITGGTIEFVGEPGVNPNLQITAEYRTRTQQGQVRIRVQIGGTMRRTEVAVTSDPPMAESDQFCFLALGAPCAGATDVASARGIIQEGLLGTIGTGLSGALVGDVGLDYLSLHSARATGVAEEPGLFSEGFFSNTELEIGKYLGSDLFVTVSQPLGSRYPGWSIEWRFSPNLTLEARAENRFARRFGLSTGSSLEFDQTFGLFLFREWSF